MGTSNNQEAWTMLYSQITKSGTLTSPNSKNYGKLQQQNTPSPDMVNVLQHGQLNQTQNLYIMGMSDSPEPKNNNMEKQPTIGISYENRTQPNYTPCKQFNTPGFFQEGFEYAMKHMYRGDSKEKKSRRNSKRDNHKIEEQYAKAFSAFKAMNTNVSNNSSDTGVKAHSVFKIMNSNPSNDSPDNWGKSSKDDSFRGRANTFTWDDKKQDEHGYGGGYSDTVAPLSHLSSNKSKKSEDTMFNLNSDDSQNRSDSQYRSDRLNKPIMLCMPPISEKISESGERPISELQQIQQLSEQQNTGLTDMNLQFSLGYSVNNDLNSVNTENDIDTAAFQNEPKEFCSPDRSLQQRPSNSQLSESQLKNFDLICSYYDFYDIPQKFSNSSKKNSLNQGKIQQNTNSMPTIKSILLNKTSEPEFVQLPKDQSNTQNKIPDKNLVPAPKSQIPKELTDELHQDNQQSHPITKAESPNTILNDLEDFVESVILPEVPSPQVLSKKEYHKPITFQNGSVDQFLEDKKDQIEIELKAQHDHPNRHVTHKNHSPEDTGKHHSKERRIADNSTDNAKTQQNINTGYRRKFSNKKVKDKTKQATTNCNINNEDENLVLMTNANKPSSNNTDEVYNETCIGKKIDNYKVADNGVSDEKDADYFKDLAIKMNNEEIDIQYNKQKQWQKEFEEQQASDQRKSTARRKETFKTAKQSYGEDGLSWGDSNLQERISQRHPIDITDIPVNSRKSPTTKPKSFVNIDSCISMKSYNSPMKQAKYQTVMNRQDYSKTSYKKDEEKHYSIASLSPGYKKSNMATSSPYKQIDAMTPIKESIKTPKESKQCCELFEIRNFKEYFEALNTHQLEVEAYSLKILDTNGYYSQCFEQSQNFGGLTKNIELFQESIKDLDKHGCQQTSHPIIIKNDCAENRSYSLDIKKNSPSQLDKKKDLLQNIVSVKRYNDELEDPHHTPRKEGSNKSPTDHKTKKTTMSISNLTNTPNDPNLAFDLSDIEYRFEDRASGGNSNYNVLIEQGIEQGYKDKSGGESVRKSADIPQNAKSIDRSAKYRNILGNDDPRVKNCNDSQGMLGFVVATSERIPDTYFKADNNGFECRKNSEEILSENFPPKKFTYGADQGNHSQATPDNKYADYNIIGRSHTLADGSNTTTYAIADRSKTTRSHTFGLKDSPNSRSKYSSKFNTYYNNIGCNSLQTNTMDSTDRNIPGNGSVQSLFKKDLHKRSLTICERNIVPNDNFDTRYDDDPVQEEEEAETEKAPSQQYYQSTVDKMESQKSYNRLPCEDQNQLEIEYKNQETIVSNQVNRNEATSDIENCYVNVQNASLREKRKIGNLDFQKHIIDPILCSKQKQNIEKDQVVKKETKRSSSQKLQRQAADWKDSTVEVFENNRSIDTNQLLGQNTGYLVSEPKPMMKKDKKYVYGLFQGTSNEKPNQPIDNFDEELSAEARESHRQSRSNSRRSARVEQDRGTSETSTKERPLSSTNIAVKKRCYNPYATLPNLSYNKVRGTQANDSADFIEAQRDYKEKTVDSNESLHNYQRNFTNTGYRSLNTFGNTDSNVDSNGQGIVRLEYVDSILKRNRNNNDFLENQLEKKTQV